jgi:hypothetical protein
MIPESSRRIARRVGLECEPAGPVMDFDGSNASASTISMATKLH